MRTDKPHMLASYPESTDMRKTVEEKQPFNEYHAKSNPINHPD